MGVCECVPESQMERDTDGSEGPADGVQQTQVLSVELPALTGYTVDAHQPVAGVQQPASVRQGRRRLIGWPTN